MIKTLKLALSAITFSLFTNAASSQIVQAPPFTGGGTLTGPLTVPTPNGIVGDLSAGSVTASGGTTPRILAAFFSDLPSARDFGVKCDGITDDSARLQAFIAAIAPGGALGTGAGFIPGSATPCMIQTALTVPSGVSLYAIPGTVTLDAAAGDTSSPLVISVIGSNVLIYGVTFDGNYNANTSYASPLAQVYQASNVTWDMDTFQNVNGIGLNVSGGSEQVSNIVVQDDIFQHVGVRYKASGSSADQHQGVAFSSGTLAGNTANAVLDSRFSDIGLDAISASNQTNFLIHGNTCNSVGGPIMSATLATAACVYLSTGQQDTGVSVTGNSDYSASGNGYELNGIGVTASGNISIANGSAGYQLDGTNIVVTGNVALNNDQLHGTSKDTGEDSGFVVAGSSSNIVIGSGNVASDTQTTPTQQFGLQIMSGVGAANVLVAPGNSFVGNAVGEASGGIAGVVMASGNVASGYRSMSGGASNYATGSYSLAFGLSNYAIGAYSAALGWDATDRGRPATECLSGGYFQAGGDQQICWGVMRASGAAAMRLTSDGSAASAENCVNIPAGGAYELHLSVVAIDNTAPANAAAWSAYSGLLARSGAASTTTFTQQTAGVLAFAGTGSGASLAITPDITNGCVNVTFSPPSGSDVWHSVARWNTTEVQ